MKRILSIGFALAMCCTSMFASWSGESFLQDYDTMQYYEFETVRPYSLAPASVDSGVSVAAASGFDSAGGGITFLEYGSPIDSSLISCSIDDLVFRRPYTSIITSVVPGYEYSQIVETFMGITLDDVTMSVSGNPNQFINLDAGILPAIPDDVSGITNDPDGSYHMHPGSIVRFSLGLDGSSSTFELSYALRLDLGCYTVPSTLYAGNSFPLSMDILVNGIVYHSLSGSEFIGSHLINSSSPIKSIEFVFNMGGSISQTNALVRDIAYVLRPYLNFRSGSFIKGQYLTSGALGAYNDEAQDALNQHEAFESEWTSSMTENFNALDMENFSFGTGVLSGFGLISGIFNDLWNAMGEYKILYVFPLTLGIALLLIGRISKFAGRGNSRSGKGDNSA